MRIYKIFYEYVYRSIRDICVKCQAYSAFVSESYFLYIIWHILNLFASKRYADNSWVHSFCQFHLQLNELNWAYALTVFSIRATKSYSRCLTNSFFCHLWFTEKKKMKIEIIPLLHLFQVLLLLYAQFDDGFPIWINFWFWVFFLPTFSLPCAVILVMRALINLSSNLKCKLKCVNG